MNHRTAARCSAALIAAAALAGCSSPATSLAPTPVATTTAAPAPVTGPATPSSSPTSGSAATVARCTAADLSGTLGPRAGEGQKTVELVFTNTSAKPCQAWGVPGVDLIGPNDTANGPTYSLVRSGLDDQHEHVTIAPGGTFTATLTYGISTSTGWRPTQIVTTPPGDTHQLVIPWGSTDTVSRQDGATHPATYIGPLTPAS